MATSRNCRGCGRPKTHRPEDYELFEQMHWLCFHLEYEHEGDADLPCNDPGCPWWHIQVYEAELKRLGADPQAVLDSAIKERYS